MTKMLDVLEAFLNHHGHRYLRLDGTTRVEQRQVKMDFVVTTACSGVTNSLILLW